MHEPSNDEREGQVTPEEAFQQVGIAAFERNPAPMSDVQVIR